jgi:hypothetical protein
VNTTRRMTGLDLAREVFELGRALNRATAEQVLPSASVCVLDQQTQDTRAQAHFEANAGKSFRDLLEQTVATFDVSLGVLLTDYPNEWAALVASFYSDNTSELVEALEHDDLLQIAAQLAVYGPEADARIGEIVRTATVAYVSQRIAAAYRTKRDVMSLRRS